MSDILLCNGCETPSACRTVQRCQLRKSVPPQDDEASSRAKFEERAFAMRFLMSISNAGKGQFPFTVDCPTKAEFIARDSKGNYLDTTLNAMWWAWQEGRKQYGEQNWRTY